jgi:ATP-dependent DNA ligase
VTIWLGLADNFATPVPPRHPAQGQPERPVLRHIEAVGEELFALACKRDLEGIVAKHKFGPYL